MKYPKIDKKRIIVLDSAGSKAPLINSNMENKNLSNNNSDIELVTELARDKIATENFIQEFIYFYSDILIVIVGQLTNDDQKLINRIKLMYGNKKNLFIIHNLMFIETIENVEKIIEDTILKSITFNNLSKINIIGENDEKQNQYYYQEELMEEKATIIHLIMAREGSEAGNYYNNSTNQFLRKQIKSFTKLKSFDIIETFKSYLSIASGTYMEKPIEIENIKYEEKEKKFIIKSKDKITFKKCYVDEMGISNFYGNIIDPPYDYKIYNNRIAINIELPGAISKFHTKLNPIGGNYVFTYTGYIKFPQDVKKIKIINDNIIDGEFRLQITLPITIGTIKDSRPTYSIEPKSGVITLIYNFCKNEGNEELINI